MKKPMLGLPMLSYQLSTAWRSLWQRPGFSLSVILTMSLTLSILLTASRLFDHLVLQPLPYPASAQLYITLLGGLSLLAMLLPLRACLQQNANQLIHQQQQGH